LRPAREAGLFLCAEPASCSRRHALAGPRASLRSFAFRLRRSPPARPESLGLCCRSERSRNFASVPAFLVSRRSARCYVWWLSCRCRRALAGPRAHSVRSRCSLAQGRLRTLRSFVFRLRRSPPARPRTAQAQRFALRRAVRPESLGLRFQPNAQFLGYRPHTFSGQNPPHRRQLQLRRILRRLRFLSSHAFSLLRTVTIISVSVLGCAPPFCPRIFCPSMSGDADADPIRNCFEVGHRGHLSPTKVHSPCIGLFHE